MRKILILAVALVAACGPKAAPVAPPATHVAASADAIQQLVCGCQGEACVAAAATEIERLRGALASAPPAEREQATAAIDAAEACRARAAAPPPADPDRALATEILGRMSGFADGVCACKDTACVEHEEKEMLEWAMANMERMKQVKPNQAEDAEADRIEERMAACKARVSGTTP